MKRYYLLGLFVVVTLLLLVMTDSQAFAGEGKVTIKSIEIAVKSLDVLVGMDIDKGSRGDHIHFYLDGKNQGVVRSNTYKIKGLGKGRHKIEAKLASKGHAEVGPKGVFEFSIK